MNVYDLIETARRHNYNMISCVIDDEIVMVTPDEPMFMGTEDFRCTFYKAPTEKNVWLNVAIKDNATLICIINLSDNSIENDLDEQDRYDSIQTYGVASKSEVLTMFPDYPYNDDYLYCVKDGVY